MACLLVVSGPQEGQYHPITTSTTLIGRDDRCDIQILDDLVSRRHLELRCDRAASRFLARDLDSANGTRLNDRPIAAETPLTDGDLIGVGDSELVFSELDFADSKTAFDHLHERGERGKSTIVK